MNQAESEALFGRMLDGGLPDEAIAATLIELADRGETAAEVAGAVRAMRARMKRITAPAGA
ncbi:MAG: anthranilate phosphoribosyltransferase, partial [Novosphingobium sp.]